MAEKTKSTKQKIEIETKKIKLRDKKTKKDYF